MSASGQVSTQYGRRASRSINVKELALLKSQINTASINYLR